MDLRANGHVLEIRGKTDRTMDLACDVAMPMAFGLDQLETVYADRALAIRVLPPARARKSDAGDEIEMHETLRDTMRVAVLRRPPDSRPSPRRTQDAETGSRPP